jgi:hypothetical protein
MISIIFPKKGWGWVLGSVLLCLFGLVAKELFRTPRQVAGPEFLVALPIMAQVALSGGDRYLAANFATFRALVASTDSMTEDDLSLQAKIQADAAWLNPAQEDNYYIAAAVLPWHGQVDAAQYILQRATESRPFDWQPPFYYAFNSYYFLKNPAEAALWLKKAAEHTEDEGSVLSFQQIAAVWSAQGPDLESAIRLHRELIRATKHTQFAAFLEKRIVRLENLLQIEKAITKYRLELGRSPENVDELLKTGNIERIPVDPFGLSYGLDKDGRPAVKAVASISRSGAR